MADAAEAADHSLRHGRRQKGVPGGDRTDCGDQLLWRIVLEDEAAGPGIQRVVDVLVEVEGREDQYPCYRIAHEDPTCRLESIELGHANVHQNQGRVEAGRLCDGLETVTGLGNHLDVLLAGEQHSETRPHHRLVVGDENTNGHEAPAWSGRRAFRTNPPPLAGAAVISPP